MSSKNDIILRKSEDRGHADHGWLNSYHTFSFASYQDPKFESFGSLRVINEDRVTPGNGFATHPHKDFEIFSYVLSGEITHGDSLRNSEVIHRGGIQFTSAGSGITHAEFNKHPNQLLHFLQVWIKPRVNGLTPTYQTKEFSEESKKNTLLKIISPNENSDTVLVQNDVHVYASILENKKSVSCKFVGSKGYIHLAQTGGSLTIEQGDQTYTLEEGDGAFINNTSKDIKITGASSKNSEFLLFDIA